MTNPPEKAGQVAVTQAERDLAADIWRDYVARVGEVMVEKSIREGTMDDIQLVQAFAAHRAASQAELVSALEKLVGWLDNGGIADEELVLAPARAALSRTKGETE